MAWGLLRRIDHSTDNCGPRHVIDSWEYKQLKHRDEMSYNLMYKCTVPPPECAVNMKLNGFLDVDEE